MVITTFKLKIEHISRKTYEILNYISVSNKSLKILV